MAISALSEPHERPRHRGKLHTWTFFVAIPAGVLLILSAERVAGRVGASIYVATVLAGFGTSAAYHRLAHSARARKVMQRLDHSMIYLLIAGTYVPICLVALPRAWGISVLGAVGAGALLGVVLKLTAFDRVPWISYGLYPVLGWGAIALLPVLIASLSPLALGLVLAGGLAYTAGLPVLLFKRPDPWPTLFGYHEIWHGFTVIAAVLHFGAVVAVVA